MRHRIMQKFIKKYELIPSQPLVNSVLSLVLRIVTTYVGDIPEQDREILAEGLRELAVDIVSESAAKMAKEAKDG